MNDNHIKQSPMLSLLSLGGGSNGIILGGSLNPVIEAVAGITPMLTVPPISSSNFPDVLPSPAAFLFNGASNSNINLTDHFNVDYSDDLVTNGFTLEFWFHCGKTTTQFIVTQMNPLGGDPNSCWRIERNNAGNGSIEFGINNAGGGFGGSEHVSFNFPDNEWHHCVCTFEPGTAKIYKNGMIDSTFSATNNPSHQPNNIVRIGARINSSPFGYGGRISEVRVWDKVLSDTKILKLYDSTAAKYAGDTFGGATSNGNMHATSFDLDAANYNASDSSDASLWQGAKTVTAAYTNTATLYNGPTWNGDFGGYFQFDGSNDYAAITNPEYSFSSDNFMMDAWVYMDTLPSSGNEYGITGWVDATAGCAVKFKNDGGTMKVIFDLRGVGSYEPAVPALTAQTWIYCACGRRNSVYYVNINGQEIGTSTNTADATNHTIDGTQPPWYIGRSFFSSRELDGRIAVARFWEFYSLSMAELTQRYNGEKSRYGL